VVKYEAPVLRGPFNLEARRLAGFSEAELARLESIAAGTRQPATEADDS
jgi:uncharacterized ferritin-like protein (DUF455 family)